MESRSFVVEFCEGPKAVDATDMSGGAVNGNVACSDSSN